MSNKNKNKIKKNKLNLIWDSIKLNYKSWFVFMIAIYCLSGQYFLVGLINFIIYFLMSYIGHYLSHTFTKNKYLSILSTIHDYHHKYDDWLGFYTEILYEFILATNITFLKIFILLYTNFYNIFFENYIFISLNILISIFYTTVHYFNYSYFHYNNTHEIHHKNENLNMGPDICDIIFNTKSTKKFINRYYINKKYNYIEENTDHYIPNIIIALIIILFCSNYIINKDNQYFFYKIFFYLYITSLIIIIISTIIIKYKI